MFSCVVCCVQPLVSEPISIQSGSRVHLFDLQNSPYKEIAELANGANGTVKKHIKKQSAKEYDGKGKIWLVELDESFPGKFNFVPYKK